MNLTDIKLKKVESQLEDNAKNNVGIRGWIDYPDNTKKAIYIAGDSTSDDTYGFIHPAPTGSLYERFDRRWTAPGYPLEGVTVRRGYATGGCTIDNFYYGTSPATVRNYQKLLNDLIANESNGEIALVILSLGLNNGSETIDYKESGLTKIITGILSQTNAYILLRMPNMIALDSSSRDLASAQNWTDTMYNLYQRLIKHNFHRTALLDTQTLLFGRTVKGIPTTVWSANTSFSVNQNIDIGGKCWRVITAGTSGSSQPSFVGSLNSIVTDGSVTWKYICDTTKLNSDGYHPSQTGYEQLTDLIGDFIKPNIILNKTRIQTAKEGNPSRPYLLAPEILDIDNRYDLIADFDAITKSYSTVFSIPYLKSAFNELKIDNNDIIRFGSTISAQKATGMIIPNDISYPYQSSASANVGDYVLQNGYTWECTTAGTTSGNFPDLNSTININKTTNVYWGTAIFKLLYKGALLQVSAGSLTPSTINNNFHRIRIYREKKSLKFKNITPNLTPGQYVQIGEITVGKTYTEVTATVLVNDIGSVSVNSAQIGISVAMSGSLNVDATKKVVLKLLNLNNSSNTFLKENIILRTTNVSATSTTVGIFLKNSLSNSVRYTFTVMTGDNQGITDAFYNFGNNMSALTSLPSAYPGTTDVNAVYENCVYIGSPDGSLWKLTIDNSGVPTYTKVNS